jgi:acetyl-CoA acetyltransferase
MASGQDRAAAIVGVYTTKQGKKMMGRSEFSLKLETIKGALDDAGLDRSQVDGDDVLGSRFICAPLHLFDCALDNEGGYAIVVASPAVAASTAKEPTTRLGGEISCNADGGLLSNSHNVSPSGMRTIEVIRHLRGECGDRQVPEARLGLSFAQGMSPHGLASTLIMACG